MKEKNIVQFSNSHCIICIKKWQHIKIILNMFLKYEFKFPIYIFLFCKKDYTLNLFFFAFILTKTVKYATFLKSRYNFYSYFFSTYILKITYHLQKDSFSGIVCKADKSCYFAFQFLSNHTVFPISFDTCQLPSFHSVEFQNPFELLYHLSHCLITIS